MINKRLASLLSEYEKFAYIGYAYTGFIDDSHYYVILGTDGDISMADLGGALEYTLHKALDAGFTDDEIATYFGFTKEMYPEDVFSEYEIIELDLGYRCAPIMGLYECNEEVESIVDDLDNQLPFN